MRIYDRYVKNIESGIERDPRVQLFVQVPPATGMQMGGFWVTGDTYPLPGTQQMRFNLRSGGHANTRQGDGVLDADRRSDGRFARRIHGGGQTRTFRGGSTVRSISLSRL